MNTIDKLQSMGYIVDVKETNVIISLELKNGKHYKTYAKVNQLLNDDGSVLNMIVREINDFIINDTRLFDSAVKDLVYVNGLLNNAKQSATKLEDPDNYNSLLRDTINMIGFASRKISNMQFRDY